MNPLIPAFGKNMSLNAKNFVEQSPKILYAVNCALELLLNHKLKDEKPSGQVFYLNLLNFTYGGVQYKTFDLIRIYMLDLCSDKAGRFYGLLNEEQVKYLTSDTNSKNREATKEGFLSGKVLILMGTATIKEGINLQKNATIMYILNSEFSPVKVMQLQGRIWRQGNDWVNCFIINVLARRSLDAFVFSKLDKKITAVREMLDSDVYEMDATQFTMDAQKIKIELTTDVEQLVKIGWVDRQKELDRDRQTELIKKEGLENVRDNYEESLEKSKTLKENFNILSKAYYETVLKDMISKIIKLEDKESQKTALMKAEAKSKKPLNQFQIKAIQYKKLIPTEAEKLVNTKENYTLDFEHTDLTKKDLRYTVLNEQLKKLLNGYLDVERVVDDIYKTHDTSKGSVSRATKEEKEKIKLALKSMIQIKKELTDKNIDVTKLDKGRRLIRVLRENGYDDYRNDWSVNFTAFESDIDQLIGGSGIAKTLSDFSVYIEGGGKKFSDIDTLIKLQDLAYDKAEKTSKDAEGEKKKLRVFFTKEMKSKNDPKKVVTLKKAVDRFKKVFPLIELK
jgi:hypothetical protein